MNLVDSLYKRLIKSGVIKPIVAVLMDGGICSQMHQYLLGVIFAEKGFDVSYDLSFFKDGGSDLDHKFVRNYDLLRAFPYLKVNSISGRMLKVYKRKFYYLGNNTTERVEDFSFLDLRAPVYLGGYYHLPAGIWLNKFHELYKIDLSVLDKDNKIIADEIINRNNSVGIHVRRGDLVANEVFAYGKPASNSYFRNAIDYMNNQLHETYYYFFSDEPDWVREVLLKDLPLTDNYRVVDINGSDKGYMDLFLMACCKHQITSKGTMGKYAAILNDNKDKLVTLCNDKTELPWLNFIDNSVLI